jgi:hypothetical protein
MPSQKLQLGCRVAAVFAGIQRQVSRVEKGEFVMADGRRGEW